MHQDYQTWTSHSAEEPLKIEHLRLISHITAKFSSHQNLCRTASGLTVQTEHRSSSSYVAGSASRSRAELVRGASDLLLELLNIIQQLLAA
jgi:hypothetical protein